MEMRDIGTSTVTTPGPVVAGSHAMTWPRLARGPGLRWSPSRYYWHVRKYQYLPDGQRVAVVQTSSRRAGDRFVRGAIFAVALIAVPAGSYEAIAQHAFAV
jgi:hypothetical protein